jgi:hypothetical protein
MIAASASIFVFWDFANSRLGRYHIQLVCAKRYKTLVLLAFPILPNLHP